MAEDKIVKSKKQTIEELELESGSGAEELPPDIPVDNTYSERSGVVDNIGDVGRFNIGSDIKVNVEGKANNEGFTQQESESEQEELQEIIDELNLDQSIDQNQSIENSEGTIGAEVDPIQFENNLPNFTPTQQLNEDDSDSDQNSTGRTEGGREQSSQGEEFIAASTEEEEVEETEVEEVPEETKEEFIDTRADEVELNILETEIEGVEGDLISLNIGVNLTDNDGSEEAVIFIDNIPDTGVLNKGENLGDGTWRLTVDQLEGLTLDLGEHTSGDFNFDVRVENTELSSGDINVTTGSFGISLEAVPDAPSLSTADASGLEDSAIELGISSELVDTDGSESLSIFIEGVPEGAILSSGANLGDGIWSVSPDDLDSLTITPPENSDQDFTLEVKAVSTEKSNGEFATTSSTISVDVEASADIPTASVSPAIGNEDQWIQLDIQGSVTDTDGSETLNFIVSNIPEGALFSPPGVDNGDGTFTFTEAQAEVLCIRPPADSDEDFSLNIQAYSTESENGDVAFGETLSLDIQVNAVADDPNLSTSDATGSEDSAIALDIQASLNDTDGSETLSVYIEGVPEGASLSSGVNLGDGVWSVDPQDLDGLSITPPENSDEDFSLEVKVISTELDGGDSSYTSSTINVTVEDSHDAPIVTVSPAVGNEDQWIALDIEGTVTDQPGILSINISNVPEGTSFIPPGTLNEDGSYTFTEGQAENLLVRPPENSDEDFTLIVQGYSLDPVTGEVAASEPQELNVEVNAVADDPNLHTENALGVEDSSIELNINASLKDTDGSETLSVYIEGVPEGAQLSSGVNLGDGVWTVDPENLSDLTITPPSNNSDDFTLQIKVVAQETSGGDSAIESSTVFVNVEASADVPIVDVSPAVGNEDQWIQLDIQGSVTDSSETLSFIVSNVPDGSRFSPAGADNGDGTFTFTQAQAEVLCILPPRDSDEDFSLTIQGFSTEDNGDVAFAEPVSLDVQVNAIADDANLHTENSSGLEDSAIDLNINASLNDTDGSETLSVYIEGVPEGAQLSSGVNLGNGVWTVNPENLNDLTITPPDNDSSDFTLQIKVVAQETSGGDTAIESTTVFVDVEASADIPVATVAPAIGNEDQWIQLDIQGSVSDSSETLSFIISDVPDGARFSPAGVDNGDGTFTFTEAQAEVLCIRPPHNDSDDFSLTIQAYSTEENGDIAFAEPMNLDIEVQGVADEVFLTGEDELDGLSGSAIDLDLSARITDTDGSEELSIIISDLPDGVSLNNGSLQSDGSYLLEASDLNDLQLLTERGVDDFEFSVDAITTETDSGDQNSTSLEIEVDMTNPDPVDGVSLNVRDVSGLEDRWINLNMRATQLDNDGSEETSYLVKGLPDGARLNIGREVEDGVWSLNDDQLSKAKVRLAKNDDTDFTITLEATTTESETGETLVQNETFDVDVQGVADRIHLQTKRGYGDEDTDIDLNINIKLSDKDGSEVVDKILIKKVPDGAELSAGEDLGNGTWELSQSDLSDLQITPPENSHQDFTLKIYAVTNELDGNDRTTAKNLKVYVKPVVDGAELDLQDVTMQEGDESFDFDIGVRLIDSDGSENLNWIKIAGLPEDAQLSAGRENSDGSWTLKQQDLSDLKLIPGDDSEGEYNIEVSAQVTEVGNRRDVVTDTFKLTINEEGGGIGDIDDHDFNSCDFDLTDFLASDGGDDFVNFFVLDSNDDDQSYAFDDDNSDSRDANDVFSDDDDDDRDDRDDRDEREVEESDYVEETDGTEVTFEGDHNSHAS